MLFLEPGEHRRNAEAEEGVHKRRELLSGSRIRTGSDTVSFQMNSVNEPVMPRHLRAEVTP